MRKKVFIGYLLGVLLSITIISCQSKDSASNTKENLYPDSISYAKGFTIEHNQDYNLVKVFNPWKPQSVLQTYILCPKAKVLPENLPDGIIIRTPLEETVCFSSVTCGFFEAIGVLHTLVGVTEPQYINMPYIDEKIQSGKIENIGQSANPNVEKLILIHPEAIFTNPINDSKASFAGKLDVPIINCFEYMETDPLGQAEWIKFIGLFFEKENVADSLFAETKNSYIDAKNLTTNIQSRPSVFTELKYGDFWYMPGGESYMANLFNDAGADYILKEDKNSGSIPLTFEKVLNDAENADYWLFKYYSPNEMTYKQLGKDYSNYTLFNAYKKRTIYVCNTYVSDYYREIPLHPDWILKDLIHIFHRDLLPDYQPSYYIKLKE